MAKVLNDQDIDKNIDISIEYKPTIQKNRIDFLIYGKNDRDEDNVIIVELKQWSSVKNSNLESHVFTEGGGGYSDYWHPSYQAYNYLNILKSFNEFIYMNKVNLSSCSYLHNMPDSYDYLLEDIKKYPIVEKSPVFLEGDNEGIKLRNFIKRNVKRQNKKLLYEIDGSNVRPSADFSKMVVNAIEGNPFFTYDDNQAYAVSTTVAEVNNAINNHERRTIIINGGPGTGKSIVAINILGKLLNSNGENPRRNACYCTSNYTPKTVYSELLRNNDYKISAIDELFKGLSCFSKSPEFEYDCILLDEAHRAYNWKYGCGVKKNVDMIDKLFYASRVNVFFIDENQTIEKNDSLTIDLIRQYAKKYNSKVIEGNRLDLTSQFRCLGGEDYISFVNALLGYSDEKIFYNKTKYLFKVFDDPEEMKKQIVKLNENYSPSRVVAGFTKEWISKKDDTKYDWELNNGSFVMKWNKKSTKAYINDPTSIDRIGCIHTIQGVDLQYCGVIIGKDMIYRNGKVIFDVQQNVEFSTKNAKRVYLVQEECEKYIRNAYKVLLTRGIKGTFVYCEDEALNKFIQSKLTVSK